MYDLNKQINKENRGKIEKKTENPRKKAKK